MPGSGETFLDLPTLGLVPSGVADLLGLFLVFCWLQDRAVRALAWWGCAYFIGAFSLALWLAPDLRASHAPGNSRSADTARMRRDLERHPPFHGRPLSAMAAFAGAALWPVLCQFPEMPPGSSARLIVGAMFAAAYTFVIAREFWRERRHP